jgi:hypothetical protein
MNFPSDSKQQDGALDGVRAIALLMVLSFHSLFLCGLRGVNVIAALDGAPPPDAAAQARGYNYALAAAWLRSWLTQPW